MEQHEIITYVLSILINEIGTPAPVYHGPENFYYRYLKMPD